MKFTAEEDEIQTFAPVEIKQSKLKKAYGYSGYTRRITAGVVDRVTY